MAEIADCVVYSKIGDENEVVKIVWRTHERKRMGGSQRSGGKGTDKAVFLGGSPPPHLCAKPN